MSSISLSVDQSVSLRLVISYQLVSCQSIKFLVFQSVSLLRLAI